jgi:hypothetical protein
MCPSGRGSLTPAATYPPPSAPPQVVPKTLSLKETAELWAKIGTSLADGYIACWQVGGRLCGSKTSCYPLHWRLALLALDDALHRRALAPPLAAQSLASLHAPPIPLPSLPPLPPRSSSAPTTGVPAPRCAAACRAGRSR